MEGPRMNPQLEINPQLETYLQQVKAHLKLLTVEAQAEELQEIRQHLQALVTAGMERGESEADAVAAALQQFGEPRKVGHALQQAWRRRADSPLRMVMAGGAVFVSNILLVVIGVLAWFYCESHFLGNNVDRGINVPANTFHPLVQGAFNVWFGMGAPLLAGWIGAWIAPRRVLYLVVPVYCTIALAAWSEASPAKLHVAMLYWLPFICLGALSRAWLVKRRLTRLS